MRYLVLFVVIVCLLASCAPPEKLMAHGWKFKDVDLGVAKDSATAAFFEMARAQMKANILFSMGSDSSYAIRQLKEGRVTRGKWWLSADKKTLYTQTELGLTPSKIIKLTSKVLEFETVDPTSHQSVRVICIPKD